MAKKLNKGYICDSPHCGRFVPVGDESLKDWDIGESPPHLSFCPRCKRGEVEKAPFNFFTDNAAHGNFTTGYQNGNFIKAPT